MEDETIIFEDDRVQVWEVKDGSVYMTVRTGDLWRPTTMPLKGHAARGLKHLAKVAKAHEAKAG